EISRDRRQADKKHILAVDDVQENLELMQITLIRHGYNVDLASSGEEAVRYFQKACGHKPYDLVLMDIQMPGTDGLAATQQIRAYETRQGLPPVPIIA